MLRCCAVNHESAWPATGCQSLPELDWSRFRKQDMHDEHCYGAEYKSAGSFSKREICYDAEQACKPQCKLQTSWADVTAKNLCHAGKLLPRFYLLGVQKAATSSFFIDLHARGMMSSCDLMVKECRYFNIHYGNLTGSELMNAWLHNLQACPQKSHMITFDMSTDYFPLVPFPDGALTTNATEFSAKTTNLPETLHSFHGKDSSKLVFAVLLRDPLQRMQSAWYNARDNSHQRTRHYEPFTAICEDCRASSFQEALNRTIRRAFQKPPIYDDWLWYSMYGTHLEAWLKYFHPRQMVIIPTKFYFLARDVIKDHRTCDILSRLLYFSLGCGYIQQTKNPTGVKHPKLETDIAFGLRRRFDKFMANEVLKLAAVVAYASDKGAHLIGFDGSSPEKGFKRNFHNWLRTGW